ncbi:DUF669 domain-containing protein [Ensifer sp. ENS04]|uniref:DUF669 domain-containing protein n=1 Tax=Ensifer sp. ENS04 TaxID=2769281 RepID=UPI0017803792|nr:DUF669 domain-containing protein [Ensifer sp. ENS04]MBD9542915.1 DUF669 domain-containing protein [Ensifer sp. ENS04]
MAVLSTTFKAQDHNTEQRTEFEELPNGIFALEIEASDVVPNKAGTGTVLKTTMRVIAPEQYAGRLMFTQFNIEHQKPEVQEIAQRQFASLCRALGVDSCDDSEQLHLIRFIAKIGLGKPSTDGQYPARAEIKRYFFPDEGDLPEPSIDAVQPAKPVAANDNARPAAAAQPAARPVAAAGGSRPWGKPKA